MCIVESTYSLSPFRVGERAMVDLQVNLFSAAAAGLAYLSRLDEAGRWARRSNRRGIRIWGFNRIGLTEASLLRELADIRTAGHAFRRPGFNRSANRGPTMRSRPRSRIQSAWSAR